MKANVIIRMGAPAWTATVMHNGKPVVFDYRKMTRDERAAFHREFMNAYRSTRTAEQPRPKAQRRRRYNPKRRAAA